MADDSGLFRGSLGRYARRRRIQVEGNSQGLWRCCTAAAPPSGRLPMVLFQVGHQAGEWGEAEAQAGDSPPRREDLHARAGETVTWLFWAGKP